MPRHLRQVFTSLAAAAALGSAAAALAPPMPASDLRGLLDSLLVLRDGHGARHLPHNDDSRRTP